MRRADWPQRLAAYIEQHRHTPFQWGTHDCCRFAAGAVEAMTGTDPMIGFDYGNATGAMRLIKKAGSLDVLLHQVLGEPLPAVAQARCGDVVIADINSGAAVGICLGRTCVFAAEPAGLVFGPRMAVRAAWRID